MNICCPISSGNLSCLLTNRDEDFWVSGVENRFCFPLQSYFCLLIKHLFFPAGLGYLSNYVMAFPLIAPSSYSYCTFFSFFNKSQDFLMGISYHAMMQSYERSQPLHFLPSSFNAVCSTCLGISAMLKVSLWFMQLYNLDAARRFAPKSFVHLAQDTVGW